MTKRVSQLLKQLNVGLDTLNQELIHMQYPQVNLNTKLSDLDCAFLSDYFMSKEMTALTNAYMEVARCRKELAGFFLHSFKPIEHLGEIEKMLYFKWIIGYGHEFLSFQLLFPNAFSLEYSEDIFEKMYKWYDEWKSKSDYDREKEEDEALDKFIDDDTPPERPKKICPDEETAIMSALKHGYGDVFGVEDNTQ